MSEREINGLKDYVSFILNLDQLNYVEESMKDLGEMIHQNNLEFIPKDKSDELNARKSVVNYLEYVTKHEHSLDELQKNFDSVIDRLTNPSKGSDDYKTSKPVFFYRGQYNAAYSLQTGIYRGGIISVKKIFFIMRCL